MKAVVPEGMPDLCLLCAYGMGGVAPVLTLSMSPQGRETPLQPVHGHNQHRTGAGRRASRSGEGLRVGSSGSCMAHELEDDPRTKSSEMETLFFQGRPKMSISPKLQTEASPTNHCVLSLCPFS